MAQHLDYDHLIGNDSDLAIQEKFLNERILVALYSGEKCAEPVRIALVQLLTGLAAEDIATFQKNILTLSPSILTLDDHTKRLGAFLHDAAEQPFGAFNTDVATQVLYHLTPAPLENTNKQSSNYLESINTVVGYYLLSGNFPIWLRAAIVSIIWRLSTATQWQKWLAECRGASHAALHPCLDALINFASHAEYPLSADDSGDLISLSRYLVTPVVPLSDDQRTTVAKIVPSVEEFATTNQGNSVRVLDTNESRNILSLDKARNILDIFIQRGTSRLQEVEDEFPFDQTHIRNAAIIAQAITEKITADADFAKALRYMICLNDTYRGDQDGFYLLTHVEVPEFLELQKALIRLWLKHREKFTTFTRKQAEEFDELATRVLGDPGDGEDIYSRFHNSITGRGHNDEAKLARELIDSCTRRMQARGKDLGIVISTKADGVGLASERVGETNPTTKQIYKTDTAVKLVEIPFNTTDTIKKNMRAYIASAKDPKSGVGRPQAKDNSPWYAGVDRRSQLYAKAALRYIAEQILSSTGTDSGTIKWGLQFLNDMDDIAGGSITGLGYFSNDAEFIACRILLIKYIKRYISTHSQITYGDYQNIHEIFIRIIANPLFTSELFPQLSNNNYVNGAQKLYETMVQLLTSFQSDLEQHLDRLASQ